MKNLIVVLMVVLLSNANAQTLIDTDFTYQGELIFNNQLVTGDYDFEVTAFDALINGTDYDAPYSVDAIPVVNGIFTLPLNFGDVPFMGNEVFLEIGVRLNGSGLPYETLTPRQKLTSSPYAIHAQFVGANSVGTVEIKSAQVQRRVSGSCVAGQFVSAVNQDGTVVCNVDDTASTTVTSADIVDGTIQMVDLANNIINNAKLVDNVVTASKISPDAVTAAAIADGAVGSSEIASGAVGDGEVNSAKIQLRVAGTCGVGEFINSVNQDGTVVCDTDSSGLTSVTGTDIVNGTIAAVDIGFEAIEKDNMKNGAITEAKIANSSIGLTKIKTNEVQQRVTSTCDEGFYLKGINEDGSVICQQLPIGLDFDFGLSSGNHQSIAIRQSTGLPIISIFNFYGFLNLIDCQNIQCSSYIFRTLDDVFGVYVGNYSSIAINPVTGFPYISYYDTTNKDLKIYICFDSGCSDGVARTLDSVGEVGLYTSIIDTDNGFPVISYYDKTNAGLKIYACEDDLCTTGTDRILDSVGDVGKYTDIDVIFDKPVISYVDSTNSQLKYYSCDDINCTAGFAKLISTTAGVGGNTNIAVQGGLDPIISYYSEANGDLMIYECSSPSCFVGTVTNLDSIGDVGKYHSMALRSNDRPLIIYYDLTNKDLKIYVCGNEDCTTGRSKILDSFITANQIYFPNSSIAIGNSGYPIISYSSLENIQMKIYSCADEICNR